MIPHRDDPAVAARFAKDDDLEAFLAELNRILAPHEAASYRDLDEVYPTLHVVGVPRSGTTLLTQLMAAHLSVGTINNLVASFWAAPTFGIRLSRHLLKRRAPSSFESDYGRTSELHEPHEFGYFWSSLLGYREMREPTAEEIAQVDWDRFRQVLLNMTAAYRQPIVFKSFMLGWYAAAAQRALAKTCFLLVRRDPLDNALSLLKARREYAAHEDVWISLKPREYSWLKDESLVTQVAGQVVFTSDSLEQSLAALPPVNVLEVSYERLCREPRQVLEDAASMLAAHGGEVEVLGTPPRSFALRRLASSAEEAPEVERALAEVGARRDQQDDQAR